MPYYGYRLYQAQVCKGRGLKPQDVSDCGGRHFAVVAEELLRGLAGTTMVGKPAIDSPDDASDEQDVAAAPRDHSGQPAFRVESVERHGTLLLVKVLAGRYSDFTMGLAATGGADVSLDGIAPSRPFRVALNLPATGTDGVLAVEDISRSCPVDHFQRWLRWASQEAGIAALQEERTEAPGPPSASQPTVQEDLSNADWWRLKLSPMADEDHLRRLIRSGKLERVQLVRHARTASRGPGTRELELTATGLDTPQSQRVEEIVLDWGRRLGRAFGLVDVPSDPDAEPEPKPTDQEAAEALAAVLGKDISHLDFDDGYVVIADAQGKSKQISPSRLSDYFIYPIQRDRRPLDVPFWRAARDTHVRIAVVTNTATLEWPSVD